MENNKLGQNPAFACITSGSESYLQEGMSKRFYAACAAMQGMLANDNLNPNGIMPIRDKIEIIYKYVDELLKQEIL